MSDLPKVMQDQMNLLTLITKPFPSLPLTAYCGQVLLVANAVGSGASSLALRGPWRDYFL